MTEPSLHSTETLGGFPHPHGAGMLEHMSMRLGRMDTSERGITLEKLIKPLAAPWEHFTGRQARYPQLFAQSLGNRLQRAQRPLQALDLELTVNDVGAVNQKQLTGSQAVGVGNGDGERMTLVMLSGDSDKAEVLGVGEVLHYFLQIRISSRMITPTGVSGGMVAMNTTKAMTEMSISNPVRNFRSLSFQSLTLGLVNVSFMLPPDHSIHDRTKFCPVEFEVSL